MDAHVEAIQPADQALRGIVGGAIIIAVVGTVYVVAAIIGLGDARNGLQPTPILRGCIPLKASAAFTGEEVIEEIADRVDQGDAATRMSIYLRERTGNNVLVVTERGDVGDDRTWGPSRKWDCNDAVWACGR